VGDIRHRSIDEEILVGHHETVDWRLEQIASNDGLVRVESTGQREWKGGLIDRTYEEPQYRSDVNKIIVCICLLAYVARNRR